VGFIGGPWGPYKPLSSIRTIKISGLILRHELLFPPPPIFNEATYYTNSVLSTLVTRADRDIFSISLKLWKKPSPFSAIFKWRFLLGPDRIYIICY
jgi:hypothetical protein